MSLGQRISSLRQVLKLTQKELAEKINISPSSIGMFEQNRRSPDSELLNKFADFFNVSVDYLLGRSDIKNSSNLKTETKAYHNLDVDGLPDEAIKQVEDYIEFVKQKYNPDGSLKKKV